MSIVLYIVLVLALLVVVYQDLKMRLIHLLLPIIILIMGLALNWNVMNFTEMGLSFLFLLLNFIVIIVYFSVKKNELTNPFDTMIGWGDVAFLIAIIPLFSFRSYLLFFVLGMLFSLIFHSVLRKIYAVQKAIPLAGYLSFFLLSLIGIQVLTQNKLVL